MSPELKAINDGNLAVGEFNPELADVFSLGLTLLRFILLLHEAAADKSGNKQNGIEGMNNIKIG